MGVSVIINTLNEEKNIERAIASISKFADEILVVDMKSDDKTASISKKLGAKVYTHARTNYVEPARNFAIEKASNNWILILDADEEMARELKDRLTQIVKEDSADFVRIPRKNIIFGKWMKHSRWWPDHNIRFFKKGVVTWGDEIHSIPVTNGRGITLEPLEELVIVHHNYETIEQFVERLNRYTSIQSTELYKKGVIVNYSDFIKKPTAEFLSRYFAGEGYKDGLHGLAVSLLQALSEVVLYAKLWQLLGFPDKNPKLENVVSEINTAQREVNYWKAHARINEGAGVGQKIKRKFKLL